MKRGHSRRGRQEVAHKWKHLRGGLQQETFKKGAQQEAFTRKCKNTRAKMLQVCSNHNDHAIKIVTSFLQLCGTIA